MCGFDWIVDRAVFDVKRLCHRADVVDDCEPSIELSAYTVSTETLDE